MKKKWLWLVIIMGLIIGTMGVGKMTKEITKEKQISFLKEHEEEMTIFIKNKDEKIAKVVYDWVTLEYEVVGNGLPQGGDKILTLKIRIIDVHNTDINSFGFAVIPDDITNPVEIKDMYTINADYDYSKGDF